MTRTAWALASVVVAAVIVGGAGTARAEDSARCQVFEIKAESTDKARIDDKLAPIEGKLEKPPFKSWNTFSALAHHREKVEQMKPLELGLEPGGEMTLLFRDLIRAEGKKPRLRLSLTLDDADGKRRLDATIKLDSGDWYLIGGEPLPDDATYILAIGCQAN